MKASTTFCQKKVRKISSLLALFVIASSGFTTASGKDLPGASETSWGVSPSGAFQFQIPVMSPAGRNGMKPNLSISYSSSQGNGSLGVGWSVSGLPAITRCGQTHATNGKATGVVHGLNDRFCMGGQQLRMVVGSVYGAAGSEYRTEVEQFAKVVAVGSGSKNLTDNGAAPTSWKVWAKDGRIYTYGATIDSRLAITNASDSTRSTHRWGLNKVEDRSGNYYTVEYRAADGLPQQINYTFNSGLSAQQKIQYVYESRPDQRTNYLFGRAIQQNVRLNKLVVSNKGSVYREYRFDYDARPAGDLRPSRLDSIEECGLNESCMPKIPVAWKAESNGFENSVSTNPGDTLPMYLTKYAELNGVDTELSYGTLADVNADGLTDLVIAVIEPNGTFKAETYLKTATGWELSPAWTLPKAIRSYNESIIGIPQFTQSQIDQGRLVDVNGDGLVDLVYSFEHFTDNTQANARRSISEVYLNSESGFSTTPSTTYVPPKIGSTNQKQVLVDYTSNGSGVSVMRTERSKLIDLNGDGLVDWVTAYFDYGSSAGSTVHTATHMNTGTGWSASKNTNYEMEDYFVEYIGTRPPMPHGEFVDINSDGLVDWVQSYQFISTGNPPTKATWLNTGSGWQKHQGSSPYVAPETIFIKRGGALLAFKRGSFIDLNSDGLPDWVTSYSESATHDETRVRLNTGRGWATSDAYKPEFTNIDYRYSDPSRGWPVNTRGSFVDVNRDGLVDYVEAYRPIKKNGVSQPEVKNLWLNTGSGWTKRNDLHPGWLLYDYDGRGDDAHKITVSSILDINSDGSPDWVKVRQGELATRVNKQSRPNQLDSIITNMGVETKPTFSSLSAMPGLYTRVPVSSKTNQPVIPAPNSRFFGTTMYVTSKLEVTRPDDTNKYNESTYYYGGAQLNRQGRGFLGFYDFSVTDERGITTRTEYHQEWPLTGMALKTVSEQAGGLLSQVGNTYDVTLIDASNAQKKRVFPHIKSSTSKKYELNGNVLLGENIKALHYDSNGNVHVETTTSRSANGSVLGLTSKTNAYHGYGAGKSGWPISLVDHSTTVFTKPGDDTISNFTNFEYYSNGQVHLVFREPGSADPSVQLITEFEYDDYGNVDSEAIKGSLLDPNERITRYEYGTNKRLPKSVINALSHVSQIYYHAVCDTPETTYDANQLPSFFTYNDFCLEKTAKGPDLVTKTTSYKWGGSQQACSAARGCQSAAKVEVLVETDGQASVSTLLNHFLQPMLVITQGMEQTEILQTTELDSLGRAVKQSQPYFSGDTPVYQEFKFDVLDRPIRTDLPFETYASAEAYISNAYSVEAGNSVVSSRDAEGKFKQTHSNALGQVVKVVDANDFSMQYRYTAQGNLKETQDHLGNIILIKYDVIGRRTQLDDPDLGLTKYRHSPFGEIIEQEDAEGLIIYSEYDQLGRMTERRVPIVDTDTSIDSSQWVYDVSEWTYDQGVNRKGLLNSVTTRSNVGTSQQTINYQKVLDYDGVSRPVSETSEIKGQSFTQRYGYNDVGLLSYREFPSSGGSEVMSINLNYKNGYLSSITDKPLNSQACLEHWRATKYDALGRLREEALGKFIHTKRLIDNAQGVVRGMQANLTIGDVQQVQNLVYDYDAANNLKLRHDQLTGVTEEFEYDDLHRLLEHKRDGSLETEVSYDPIGNIKSKSDVGIYHYDGNKPHALSSVTLDINQSSNLGQFNINWEWDGETISQGVPSIHGQTFTYDKKGSIKRSGNRALYWTAFSKPHLMISEKANGEQHGSKIEYDADFQRMYKQEATYTVFGAFQSEKETTYYVGKDYERIQNADGVKHRYHIKAGSHAIQIEREDGTSQDDPKYLLTDNLGSTNVIINKHGKVEQRLAFDPWGMRTESDPLLTGEVIINDSVNDVTARGYTGHEMDDEVGLINMNARIYDPYLGRFLSADPVLPDAGDMQQFNRYSYVTNNPLKFTDPTGNFGIMGVGSIGPGGIGGAGFEFSINFNFFDFLPIGLAQERLFSEANFATLNEISIGGVRFCLQECDYSEVLERLARACEEAGPRCGFGGGSSDGDASQAPRGSAAEAPTIGRPQVTITIPIGPDSSFDFDFFELIGIGSASAQTPNNNLLTTSLAGRDFIKRWEGFSANPYKVLDANGNPSGNWTVGYGSEITDAEYRSGTFNNLSQAQAELLFLADLAVAEASVHTFMRRNGPTTSVNQNQFDALVSLTFNSGYIGRFPNLSAEFSAGNHSGVAREFLDITNNGITGLQNRRVAEVDIYLNANYSGSP